MHPQIDVDCGETDFVDGAYERVIPTPDTAVKRPSCCRVQLLMPRTNASPELQDECFALATIFRAVAAEFSHLNIRVHDPTDFDPPSNDLPRHRVLIRDQRHIRDASVVVVIANGPSSGMGTECERAARGTVPRMLVVRKGTRISRVLEARIAPTVASITYTSLHDFRSQLREVLPEIAEKVLAYQSRREDAEFVSTRLHRDFFKCRVHQGRTLSSISEATNIPEDDLRELECDPKPWSDVPPIQLQLLGGELHMVFCCTGNGPPALTADINTIPDRIDTSLENLYDALKNDGIWIPCEEVLQAWNAYRDEADYVVGATLAEAREDTLPIWDVDTWLDRLRAIRDMRDKNLWDDDV